MTAKEIYESIDLSKLKKDTADKLRGLEKKTKGFTLKSDKVDAQMKKFYDTLKERKPDALKNLKVEVKKVEEKAKNGEEAVVTEVQKVVGKKKVAKKTATPSAPKKRTTVATLAKAIRRKGESWQSALKRAGEQMKSERKAAESATKTELEKLRKMIKSDPKFSDYPRTYGKQSKAIDVSKDAKTKARPAGKRVSKKGVKNQYGTSKGGRTYWENRDNRSDRNAPNYPTKVYLEYGGSLATQPYWLADNADALVSTETMGEMFEVGGQVFTPTEQLADNPNALVSTNTYAELFAQGGKLDITSMFEKGGKVKKNQRITKVVLTDFDEKGYNGQYKKVFSAVNSGNSLGFGEGVYELDSSGKKDSKGNYILLLSEGLGGDEETRLSKIKGITYEEIDIDADMFEKGGTTPESTQRMQEKLINDLWDRKGYDISYLKELPLKQLKSLYDTEFYYEDEFFEKGGMVNLYYGGEQEDETLPASSEKDAANIAMRNGAEHYEFVPRMKKGGKVAGLQRFNDKIGDLHDDLEEAKETIEEVQEFHRNIYNQDIIQAENKYLYNKGGMVTASRTAMEIGALTGMNKNAIQKFVDDNNLDIERLYKFVLKSSLKQRMDMVSAIAGSPNNPIQKKIIKTFAK